MRLDLPQQINPKRGPRSVEPADASLQPGRRKWRGDQVPARGGIHRPREGRTPDREPDPPLDRRSRRSGRPGQPVRLSLRIEERAVLAEVGRFRVVASRDLGETIYGGRRSRLEPDLALLRKKGLIQINSVDAGHGTRGGMVQRLEVVTLTQAGCDVARLTSGLPRGQKLYAGIGKLREVEHDAQIYRAYCSEAERIGRNGGTNLRVLLDFELRSEIQKVINAERRSDPQRSLADIKQHVARKFDLPYANGGIQIPDARVQYDLDQGSRTGHEDIEVLTGTYKASHLRNKAQAGFHVYASSSDRARLSARIEANHELMESIWEL
jgi:hypothetical protein